MDIIGFIAVAIIAFIVTALTCMHLLILIFHQMKFMNKLRHLNIINTNKRTYVINLSRVLIYTGVSVGILFIPLNGVLLGSSIGWLVAIKSGASKLFRNSISIEVMNDIERNSTVKDPIVFNILKNRVSEGVYTQDTLIHRASNKPKVSNKEEAIL